MIIISEFKNLNDLNDYLATRKSLCEVVPVPRTFINPSTNMLTSTITYVVIENIKTVIGDKNG